jgi:hypothetical protein
MQRPSAEPKRPDQYCRVEQGISGHLTLRILAVLANPAPTMKRPCGVAGTAFTVCSGAAPQRREYRVGVVNAAAPRAAGDGLQGRPEAGIVGKLWIG